MSKELFYDLLDFFYVKIYLETTKHQNEKETERGYEMMKDCKGVLKTFRLTIIYTLNKND